MERRYFKHLQESSTIRELYFQVLPPRPDHVVRLLGYRLEVIISEITYSTTATWRIDVVLSAQRVVQTGWSLDSAVLGTTPYQGQTIDAWRMDGGTGRIQVEGAYLINANSSNRVPPVVTDILVPGITMNSRRLAGLDQIYGLSGYIDFEWKKANEALLAAVNLAWNTQLSVAT